MTKVVIKMLGGKSLIESIIVLLDTAASATMVNQRIIPQGVEIKKDVREVITTTVNCEFDASCYVEFDGIKLPDFHSNKTILGNGIKSRLFYSPLCRHNMIISREFLRRIGVKLDFNNMKIEWDDRTIDMSDEDYRNYRFNEMESFKLKVKINKNFDQSKNISIKRGVHFIATEKGEILKIPEKSRKIF